MNTTVKDWYKIAKDWIYSNKEYVAEMYKKNGQSPSVQSDIMKEVTSFVLESELKEYNERVEQFDEYIEGKKQEIKNLYTDMQTEIDEEKSIYERNMKEVLDSHLNILDSEGKYIDKLKADMKGHMESLSTMEVIVGENKDALVDFVKKIKDVEIDLKGRFDDIIIKNKKVIDTYFQDKKSELGNQLSGYYEPIKKELDEKKEQYTTELQKNFDSKMARVDKVVDETYLKQQMEVKSKMKKGLDDSVHFNFDLFIKYIAIFGFTALIVFVDFYMVQTQVIDEIGGSRVLETLNSNVRMVFEVVIPIFFSLGIILGEYFNKKLLKSKIVTVIIYFLLIFIVSLTVLTFDGFTPTLVQELSAMEFIARALVFLVFIPINIHIMYKYVAWYEVVEFVMLIVSIPFRIVRIPFFYLAYLIELSAIGKRKVNILDELGNTEDIMKSINIDFPSFQMDMNKIQLDYDGDEEHNYSEIFSLGQKFDENLNNIEHTLRRIKDDIGDFNNDIQKSDQIIDEKMFVLKEILKDFNERLNETIKSIESKYIEPVATLKETIESRSDQWSNYRRNFQHIEIAVKKGVLEGLNEIGR